MTSGVDIVLNLDSQVDYTVTDILIVESLVVAIPPDLGFIDDINRNLKDVKLKSEKLAYKSLSVVVCLLSAEDDQNFKKISMAGDGYNSQTVRYNNQLAVIYKLREKKVQVVDLTLYLANIVLRKSSQKKENETFKTALSERLLY